MRAFAKPGASLRTHHLLAASIWSLIGLLLMARGYSFLRAVSQVWLFLPAVLAGTCKSLLLLDKSARRNLARLSTKADGACLGGVYSLKMWGLVVMMILLGWLLRHSGLASELIGTIYVAIGWALFFSSRLLWQRALTYTH